MKKFLLLILLIVTYFFFRKKHLAFELIGSAPSFQEQIRPDAYLFFHSKSEYAEFLIRTEETRNYIPFLPNANNLDFEKYSYCIFFGRKVSDLFYSYKTTYFDDKSPDYAKARRSNKKCVFVSYAKGEENGIFLYRVAKDEQLRGFDGL